MDGQLAIWSLDQSLSDKSVHAKTSSPLLMGLGDDLVNKSKVRVAGLFEPHAHRFTGNQGALVLVFRGSHLSPFSHYGCIGCPVLSRSLVAVAPVLVNLTPLFSLRRFAL